MESSFRFDRFTLDSRNRTLLTDDAPVELNARYLDALILLVSESGGLVSKDRFMDEVWRGVPVTDEALTQCIKTLRRQLSDDATNPRFIETVPKYGYRFIAAVEPVAGEARAVGTQVAQRQPGSFRFLLLGAVATVGGGMAGLIGGIFYGFAGASQPLAPGMGAISVLLVLMCLCILVGMAGGAGVGLGLAAADPASRRGWYWSVIGGGGGGLAVGAIAKLLGVDAFNLLLGQSPGNITGAGEGVLLGGAVGLGVWLASRVPDTAPLWRRVAPAALVSAAAGVVLALLGGRLMGGSLDLLARQFPESRLRLDQIGAMLGEDGFGLISQSLTCGIEAMLFGTGVATAMLIARRNSIEGI